MHMNTITNCVIRMIILSLSKLIQTHLNQMTRFGSYPTGNFTEFILDFINPENSSKPYNRFEDRQILGQFGGSKFKRFSVSSESRPAFMELWWLRKNDGDVSLFQLIERDGVSGELIAGSIFFHKSYLSFIGQCVCACNEATAELFLAMIDSLVAAGAQ